MMSAVTGIVAGLVTAAGAVALYKYMRARAAELRGKLERARAPGPEKRDGVIDFERDPQTGVFHAK